MPGSFIERDLKAVFSSRDFSETDGAVTLNGMVLPLALFDNEDIQVEETGSGFAKVMSQPTVTCPTTAVVAIAEKQIVVVRGVSYPVTSWFNNGDETTTLYLGKPA
jgi:hypothetical protein